MIDLDKHPGLAFVVRSWKPLLMTVFFLVDVLVLGVGVIVDVPRELRGEQVFSMVVSCAVLMILSSAVTLKPNFAQYLVDQLFEMVENWHVYRAVSAHLRSK